jgi:hypothetical protein
MTKWESLSAMWAGLGLFLVAMGLFVALPLYKAHNETQLRHDKITACRHATDVLTCLQAIATK